MSEELKTVKKTTKPANITDGVSVKVRSGFYGKLYYTNPRSGESFMWNQVGDVQFLTIGDLKAMKAQCPGYFKNQWVVILGCANEAECSATPAEICKHLAIDHYYKDYIDPVDFAKVCEWTTAEVAERISLLGDGAKQNLIVALKEFIKDGRLDSIKKIKEFEKALDCVLE